MRYRRARGSRWGLSRLCQTADAPQSDCHFDLFRTSYCCTSCSEKSTATSTMGELLPAAKVRRVPVSYFRHLRYLRGPVLAYSAVPHSHPPLNADLITARHAEFVGPAPTLLRAFLTVAMRFTRPGDTSDAGTCSVARSIAQELASVCTTPFFLYFLRLGEQLLAGGAINRRHPTPRKKRRPRGESC